MEAADRELISRVITKDKELKRLYRQHQALEEELGTFEKRGFLTITEQAKVKKLKARKLKGKERLMQLLAVHRTPADAVM